MKITYLINQVQPDGSTRLSAVSVNEWRSAIRENEGLPPERQRYFIRDYIADENDMDCMVIEVSASEYIQWDKGRSAARRNREAGKNFHVSSLDAPLAGMDCTMARLEQLPDQTQLELVPLFELFYRKAEPIIFRKPCGAGVFAFSCLERYFQKHAKCKTKTFAPVRYLDTVFL